MTSKRHKSVKRAKHKPTRARSVLRYDRRDQISEIIGNIKIVQNSMPGHYPKLSPRLLSYFFYCDKKQQNRGYVTIYNLRTDFNICLTSVTANIIDPLMRGNLLRRNSPGKYVLTSYGLNYITAFNRIMINLLNTGFAKYNLKDNFSDWRDQNSIK